MTPVLCVASHCAIPRRHVDDCPQDGCPGCLPGQAADGVRLCDHHVRAIAYDAARIARLYPALGNQLIPTSRPGEYTSGSSHGAPAPAEHVIELRARIQRLLVDTTRLVIDRRGVRGPVRWSIRRLPERLLGPPRRVAVATGNREALAVFIARHATWLAAQPEAGELSEQFHDLGRPGGDAWRAAFPAGPSRMQVGTCPFPVEEEDGSEGICGSRLYGVDGEPLVTCSGCGRADTIEQWRQWLASETGGVVDAYAGAAHLSTTWWPDHSCAPGTIWSWTSRKQVDAIMEPDPLGRPDPDDPDKVRMVRVTDERGRTLYRLADLIETATKLWGPSPKPSRKVA